MSQTPVEPDRGPTTGTPRWVKMLGILGIVTLLVLRFVIPQLTGYRMGDHTPHMQHGVKQP